MVWRCTHATLALWSLRQEDDEFKANLNHILKGLFDWKFLSFGVHVYVCLCVFSDSVEFLWDKIFLDWSQTPSH